MPELLYWRITETPGRALRINWVALPLALVFGLAFSWFARVYGNATTLDSRVSEWMVFALGILVLLAIHEAIHGILMWAFGARPRFGFWLRGGMFYAKAPGHGFTRHQYLAVVLGPLVILSLLACVGILLLASTTLVWFIALWAVVNAAAANADLWIAAVVLRCPADARIVDEIDGFRVLLPSSESEHH